MPARFAESSCAEVPSEVPVSDDGWVRLHPLSPLLNAGRFTLAGVVVGLQVWADAAEALAPDAGLFVRAGGALALAALLALGYAAVAWRYRVYRVAANVVELKTGVVYRSYRQLPLDRIESVDTTQSLVARLLGLAEVRIEAISKKGSELRLRYLSFEDAEELRVELAARRRDGHAPSAAADEEAAAGERVFTVEARELVTAYLVVPALVGAALLVVALVVGGLARGVDGVVVVLVFTVFAAVSMAVAGLVRLERVWDFRLDDTADALVVHRGLLNLTTQRIVPGRIQALRVDQPLLWRVYGRHRVVVDVAGYRGANREDAAAASVLLPVAPYGVVRDVVERLEVRADLGAVVFEPVPRRARWRSLRWRSFGVAVTDTHAVVRTGVLWRRIAVVPRRRLQSTHVRQGPWQRRLRLATVQFDTAGGRIKVAAAHRDIGDAVALADGVLRR